MFIAALFATAKTWKQPKYLLTEEWIRKMWYISITEYYSAIKKTEIMPFVATCRDLEITILSEVSQTEKDTHTHTHTHIYMYQLSVKYIYIETKQMSSFTKQKLTHRKQTSGYHGVRMGERDRVEDWD